MRATHSATYRTFPKPGVVFKDITPLLGDAVLFERVTDWMVERFRERARPTHVLGIESRGFLFGAPVAHRLGAGFVPARKPGKLPWKTVRVSTTTWSTGPTRSKSTGMPFSEDEPGPDRGRPARHWRDRKGRLRSR